MSFRCPFFIVEPRRGSIDLGAASACPFLPKKRLEAARNAIPGENVFVIIAKHHAAICWPVHAVALTTVIIVV